jgi:two-component system chemotaxis response regulator CheY
MQFNIMIVDDSEVMRAMLGKVLQMSKIPLESLMEAENGVQALAQLETYAPDVILSDINMPEMDGITFVHHLRQRPEWADIPVVIISTEGSKNRIDELKELGISDYLRKPFTPEGVRNALVKVLGEWDE